MLFCHKLNFLNLNFAAESGRPLIFELWILLDQVAKMYMRLDQVAKMYMRLDQVAKMYMRLDQVAKMYMRLELLSLWQKQSFFAFIFVSENYLKGTIVNWRFPSLNEGELEIMFSVPLINRNC